MRITEKEFFSEKLNKNIPEMKKASDLFAEGKTDEANKVFTEYVREFLRDGKLHSRPVGKGEGSAGKDDITYADMVTEGYMTSVHFTYQFKDGIIDWLYNPTFNKYCEFSFHLQYHSEFIYLSSAYEKTHDEKYAKRFDYLINSWIKQAVCPDNKPKCGGAPIWRTIEAGGRMSRNWPRAISTFIYSPSVPDSTWVNVFRSICEHGYRLSGSHSQNAHHNWVIHEMIGLITQGLAYPFLAESEDWYNTALKILKEETVNQVYPDGMQIELTTGYHSGIISNYIDIISLLKLYNRDVPEEFYNALNTLFQLYTKLTHPCLNLPGLNDSGNNIEIGPYMRKALTLFPDNQEYAYFASERRHGQPPKYTSINLPYSGMTVLRTGWEEDDFWAFFDGALEGNAHWHEDKLNFMLYAYKTDMLPDSGTYAYDTSDMRKYVLSTRSHNTGLVDGFGQNRTKNHKYGVVDTHKKSEVYYRFGDDAEIVCASYNDGYGPELIKVKHTRKVVFMKNGFEGSKPFYILLDKFESGDEKEHVYEVSFQLPVVPVNAVSHTVTASYSSGATLQFIGDKYPKVIIGQYAPEFIGWRPIHSPLEHEHAPAPVVAYAKKGLSANFATVLMPSPDSVQPEIAVSLDGDKGFTLTFDGKSKYFDYTDKLFDCSLC